jgi:acyl-CoA thioesterase
LEDAFFEKSGDSYVPGELARGPWSPDSLHGRVLAGLCAHEIEREHWEEPLHIARLTVDMFRLPRIEPLQVRTERIRDGRRIRVAVATVTSEGREIARATAVMLRRSQTPDGNVWKPPAWDAPLPDQIPRQPTRNSNWVPMWETRPIGGETFGGSHRKRAWLRETYALVAGEPLSPFVRVASSSDFASPLANSGDKGLHYVNADITLYLHRLPVGEWVGYEVASHESAEGVAIGDCTLYDEQGSIGKSIVCAVANQRPAGA